MTYLAVVIVLGIVAYVLADIARGRTLRKNMLRLSEAFRGELANLREASKGIDALRDHVEAQMILAAKEECKPAAAKSDFPDIAAVVLERPYTRLSLESGTHRIIAAIEPSGNISFKQLFNNADVLFVKEFDAKLPKNVAQDLLTFMIEDYNQLTGPTLRSTTTREKRLPT